MGLSVEFKDVTPRNFKLAGDHSFSVSVAGQKLGYLILTPSDLVLSWNGRMDFAVLEEQVLGELPRSFCAGPISAQGNDVKILTRDGGIDEYLLSDCDDPKTLKRLLADPNTHSNINFIRVNGSASAKSLGGIDFSFTSDNAPVEEENELAVKLPRGIPMNGSLIDWVMRHHASPPQLGQPPDYDFIAAALSRKARQV
ncbi:hypothetical protein A3B42_03320 [Candidatus Daviesbacteria bacterium RIFCSPLOWO2_01_FULL_38_10]|nr:MAG: hypothetical protein A3D02_01125 [Candidatus Daviesbacteria bacterium RIFCSPHIGHO2_02_FULL_39_41]OGE37052.1 MAG: hypothetical protein A3B42_03320 [Candidatus Daviesbacteria bacterium RIFCSPLOWO2_01_FULL_38_10]OGE43962.1 MAG: hypothetical protein A3E67_00735 [Candidatus Daviesbacteria bacterium RIFCSPHIGHO2_12_FULL_38_25]OGE67159.1 MAG: hypothetical protein A3H81_04825 [Candidatus Daviesbacteria bacterium RIFCSPLOWO2_02_FULL_38_18]OGE73484.1 MAG: hypothetical protein A3H18_03275 [Candida